MERNKFKAEKAANEAYTEELRQRVEKLKDEKRWLIRTGVRHFITYLHHRQEFNDPLVGIYHKVVAHGRHTTLIAGLMRLLEGSYQEPSCFQAGLSARVCKCRERDGDVVLPQCRCLVPDGGVFAIASTKRALFETSGEEGDDVGLSSKKIKTSEEPEQVTSMSIPIDVALLSVARVESAPLATKDEDRLCDGLPKSSLVPQGEEAADEGVKAFCKGIVVIVPFKGF
ncbi:hypothetical protein HanIR_Chr17g0897891 [Helianthus annuus]|nr:hypothetical protein HanIR_Chr17g0897891 [Helianthus annuus]